MGPKYLRIEKEIKEMIRRGIYKPGDKIYSESELKAKFGVSSTTIVKALQNLVADGYLIRRQGEGTFVRKNYKFKKVYFNEEIPFLREGKDARKKNIKEHKKILFIKEITDLKIANKLKISEDDVIVHFCRLGYLNNIPWLLQNSYIPKSKLSGLDYKNKENFNSISRKLKESIGIDLIQLEFEEVLDFIYPPDEKITEYLDIKKEVPVIRRKRLSFHNYEPFEYAENFMNHEYYSIKITTKEDDN